MKTFRNGTGTPDVLLVDDNDDDVLFTQRGFQRASRAVNVHRVENGQECLDFLRKERAYAECPTPDLVLLDLNMPVMDGREALSEIVADPNLQHIPVVILSTSEAAHDVMTMYGLRCSSFIAKPVGLEHFHAVIQRISDYWFDTALLPNTGT